MPAVCAIASTECLVGFKTHLHCVSVNGMQLQSSFHAIRGRQKVFCCSLLIEALDLAVQTQT